MAFCTNCGEPFPDGAKFCAKCGSPTTVINEDRTKRKNVFDGELHKCPNCGDVLNAFVSCCPTCGYELRGTKAAESVYEFSLRLERTQSETQRIMLVRNFPIPNAKEDIVEFMILVSTNLKCEQNKNITDAWLVKFEQCYQKANWTLQDDPDFDRIQEIYIHTHKEIKKSSNKKNMIKTGSVAGKLTINLFRIIGRCIGFFAGIIFYIVAIGVDRAGENSVGWQMLGGILLFFSVLLLGRKHVKNIEFCGAAFSVVLSFVLAKFLENGVFLQLAGVVLGIFTVLLYIVHLFEKDEKE